MSRKKILWLASWYPNKLAPFNGDFIQRHAEAVSLYEDIQLIYVVRDARGDITKNIHIEESDNEGLSEKIIYYYSLSIGISFVDKFFSEIKFRKLYKRAVFDYIEKTGMPNLVNVHIGMKAGIIANWLKKKKKIPYVVSEHWTGLLTEADDKISNRPFYFRLLWKKIISGASAISAVSIYLADAIKNRFGLQNVTVIPNVVNTSIFYPALTSTSYLKFIHISTLENFKNPKAIINALALVIEIYPSVILDIFGPDNKQVEELVVKLGVKKNIHFHNEIPQLQLAVHIRQSLALILYSAYETFGCVIAEANACGIPVIVSDIPVLHETVTEGMNGIFAKPNDSAALAEKMIEMIKTRTSFDSNAIVSANSKYSYEKVGRQFSDWYDEILSNKT